MFAINSITVMKHTAEPAMNIANKSDDDRYMTVSLMDSLMSELVPLGVKRKGEQMTLATCPPNP